MRRRPRRGRIIPDWRLYDRIRRLWDRSPEAVHQLLRLVTGWPIDLGPPA